MSFLRPAIIPLLNFHPDHAPCVLKRLLLTTGAKFCHVRKSCVFTHWKNSHEGEVVALKRHFVLWCARRGWSLWRFASLIPSGWRLTPIHKVMGDHASRGSTPAGLFCHVFFFCDPFRCHFLILVDSDWSLSLKLVYSGCSFFGSIFRGSFCIAKTF